jgi:restriction system protein
MTRKRRRSSSKWRDYAARLIIILGLLTYAPIVAWWQNLSLNSRFFMLATIGVAATIGVGIGFAFLIYRKREREKVWRLAVAAWQNNGQATTAIQRRSALYLSDIELERLAAQVYKKMGYTVEHVGQMGDHGIDVLLVNPNNQKEIVQCKQWSKPVGEPVLRDLYGAMMHDQAIRGWLWAPRGFSGPAKAWAKGKPIVLVDDIEINRLIGIAYKTK